MLQSCEERYASVSRVCCMLRFAAHASSADPAATCLLSCFDSQCCWGVLPAAFCCGACLTSSVAPHRSNSTPWSFKHAHEWRTDPPACCCMCRPAVPLWCLSEKLSDPASEHLAALVVKLSPSQQEGGCPDRSIGPHMLVLPPCIVPLLLLGETRALQYNSDSQTVAFAAPLTAAGCLGKASYTRKTHCCLRGCDDS